MTVLTRPSFYILRPEEVDQVWSLIAPGVARALETSDGETDLESTRAALATGRTTLMLFGGEDSYFGVIFQFLTFPKAKVFRIILAFGKRMEDQRKAFAEAEAWAKRQGCKWVEAWVATESRVRLFGRYGYRPRYTVIRKELP